MNVVQREWAGVALGQSGGAYSEDTASLLPGMLEGSDELFAAVDPDLRLVAFNAAFRRGIGELSGEAPELEQPLDALLTGLPGAPGMVIELCRRALAGEALRWPLELAGQRGKRYFNARFSPVSDPSGRAQAVAMAWRDVTDQRVSELKLHGVLEATPDAMLVVRQGIIEFANSQTETMFGYAQGALQGAAIETLVPERMRERHVLQRIGFEYQPQLRPMGSGLELIGRKADGSEFPVEISLSPLEIEGERLVIAAVRDISLRKQAEEKLLGESAELRKQLAMLQRQQEAPSDLEVYRAGFEKAAAALIHYGPDGHIRRVNSCFCRLLDYSREELMQFSIQKLTHPDDLATNTDLDIKLLAGALADYQVDKRLLRKDQRALWVRMAVSLQRDARGNPDYVIGVAEDITERKQAEDALREARLRLSMATEIARVGYAELEIASKATYLSPELKRQLGYDDPDMPNAFNEWSRRLHPGDSQRVTMVMQNLIAEPKGGLALEYRLCHRDGNYRWFSGRVVALEDAPGHAYKLLFTQIDITERKLAEQTLREQAEELRLALRVGRSGTFQWDAETHEHRWYDEILALYGLTPEEFGGRDEDWLGCIVPEDRAAAMAAVEASLESGGSGVSGDYAAEFRIQRRNDGTIRWISARGQVFFDAAGVPKRMVGINVDVTEQRQIQTQLEESKARLQAVLNSLKEGVILFDAAGHVLDTNPAAIEILRYGTPEIARRHLEEFVHSCELTSLDGTRIPVNRWPLSRVLRGESFSDYELVVHRKNDGLSLVISYNGAPIRGGNGAIVLGVLSLVDISERKRAEQSLVESERRLSLALKAGNTAVWEIDVTTQKLLPAEDLLFTMLGYEPGELSTVTDWVSRIHDEDRPGITQLLNDVIRGKREGYFGVELRECAKDGSWRWILCQVVAAERDAHGKATRLVGTHTDIHARKMAEEHARQASLHDPLTGLPNRGLVFEYGSHLLAAAQRSHNRGALLFIDLDRFKPINDQYGHEVGDRLLQQVSTRLSECTRGEDLVGRLGGDEFIILLAHLDGDRPRASIVARHVIDSLSEPFRIDALEVSTSPSIGISYYPEHANSVEGLIHAADLAMYQAKQSGRANFRFYSPELDQRADAIYLIEARIKDALKHGRLMLHYQPVMDIKSGKLIGAEALLRLPNAGSAPSGPATFIPIAEATGLIGELGTWVATEACRQHEVWRRGGMAVTIAINVSPLQFRQRDFPEKLSGIIAKSGIDPTSLQLEVTESTVMENVDDAVEILNRIKSLGVKVALDDFGTGYSSLSRLSRLPLDKLKVDQSFIRGIGSDPASRAVTEAIIALGRNLKLEVIGEGIESEDALHYLEEHGCDEAQGFLISQPMPAAEFEQWYLARQVH